MGHRVALQDGHAVWRLIPGDPCSLHWAMSLVFPRCSMGAPLPRPHGLRGPLEREAAILGPAGFRGPCETPAQMGAGKKSQNY